jgi:hypothetical protein
VSIPAPRPRFRIRDAVAVVSIAALLLWIPLLAGLGFDAKRDESEYHLPLAQELTRRPPNMDDLRGGPMHMGPFFHIVLGGVGRVIGDQPARFRLVMALAGIAAAVLFARAAHRVPGADWRTATVLLAAFPYFGAVYFTVMTDWAAFLALVAAWLAQLRYLQTGGRRALWGASLAGLLACLVRQTMIFAPGVFAAFVLWERWRNADGARRAPSPEEMAALALPFAAIAARLWLWGGLMPPTTLREGGFLGLEAAYDIPGGYPAHFGLAVVSMAANVGYYLIPAVFALAAARRPPRRSWVVVLSVAAGITLAARGVRGPELITTYGTFLHGVTFVRLRFGEWASLGVVALSLSSFGLLVDVVRRDLSGSDGARERRLLAALLVGGFAAFAFGKFRIFERYVLPLHALALLLLSAAAAGRPAMLVRAGIVAAALFGLVHEILYASDVYDLGIVALPGR